MVSSILSHPYLLSNVAAQTHTKCHYICSFQLSKELIIVIINFYSRNGPMLTSKKQQNPRKKVFRRRRKRCQSCRQIVETHSPSRPSSTTATSTSTIRLLSSVKLGTCLNWLHFISYDVVCLSSHKLTGYDSSRFCLFLGCIWK